MYCSECGNEINNDAKFCPHCGAVAIEEKYEVDQKDRIDVKQPEISEKSIATTKANKPYRNLTIIVILAVGIIFGANYLINKHRAEKEAQAYLAEQLRMEKVLAEQQRKAEETMKAYEAQAEAEASAKAEAEAKRRAESETYEAVLSCGMSPNDHINIIACFAKSGYGADTELEIKSGGQYGMYKFYNITAAGKEYSDGLHIPLSHNFTLKAQNSHNLLMLTLKILDSKGSVVFEKSASQYGVIAVSN